jgi:hypothetical protein
MQTIPPGSSAAVLLLTNYFGGTHVPGCENNALIDKENVCAFSRHQGWQRTNQPDREGCLHAGTARRDDPLVPVCMSFPNEFF